MVPSKRFTRIVLQRSFIMQIVPRLVLTFAVMCLTPVFQSEVRAALITFSGLHNGITTATDPEDTSTSSFIPINYQPLQNAYPAPGGNVDGANLGVSITWGTAKVAEFPDNPGVNDHTHQVTPTDNANENLLDIPHSTITLTFSAPVTLPDLWFGYNSGPTSAPLLNTSFSGFTLQSDSTPVVAFDQTYPGGGPIVWQEVTGFGTTPLEKITIITDSGNTLGGTDGYFQLDDITVSTVPEPASLAMLMTGGLASLVWLSRWNRVGAFLRD
jgi:hypothetical protein